jgi:superfamily I DNA/RNA helicase
VGENTKHVIDVIARSTPFSADQRIADYTAGHQRLTSQANYLRFVNPAGYLNYYANATVNDIHHEVRRIIQHEWLMWQHTPGLLVVEGLDEGYQLSDASREALQPLAKRDYIRWVTLDEIKDIKGLEFQHVFIFVGLKLFKELQAGFSGTGRRIYDQRRLLRIPFSRAKDSLVTFAL